MSNQKVAPAQRELFPLKSSNEVPMLEGETELYASTQASVGQGRRGISG